MSAPSAQNGDLGGVCYGSVREALGLGPGPAPAPAQSGDAEEGMSETIWAAPEVRALHPAAFRAALDTPQARAGGTMKQEGKVRPEPADLLAELVRDSRRAHLALTEEKRQCARRQQAEARITAAWAQTAGATTPAPAPAEETPRLPLREPQLPLRTPDPLHSPFPRFPPNF